MARLKVLFITVWYPSPAHPISGVFVREHARAIQRYDNVVVLHFAGRSPQLKQRWLLEQEHDPALTGGMPTYRLHCRNAPIPKAWYLTYLWSVQQTVRSIVAQGFRPDVLHAHVYEAGVPAVLLGRLYRIAAVVTEHFSGFPRKLLSPLDVCKARLAFGWADWVMPVSNTLQAAIETYGIKARFRVIPNVVDTAMFTACTTPRVGAGLKRLLFVGLFDPAHIKGAPFLLQALAQLRHQRADWHLDLVGDGPPRAAYERLVANLGIGDKVTFHGLKPKAEVAELMRRADLFVLASLSETFATVLAEAMATGTPVLATRCGGPEEFVTDEVGMLAPPGDATALCVGLSTMLDHLPDYSRERIARYARERFAPEQVGAMLHDVYATTLAARQRR